MDGVRQRKHLRNSGILLVGAPSHVDRIRDGKETMVNRLLRAGVSVRFQNYPSKPVISGVSACRRVITKVY
jgi:hypothetical protein